ncbi:MAG: sigma-70 family RNA polymerase sigma factor [Chryseosolibacter sp.]
MPLRISHRKTAEDTESELIEGLKGSGVERKHAEKKLFEHFFYLTRTAQTKYNLGNEDCASVYSDTMIVVIQNINSGKFEGRSSLKTYTYEILMNKCVDGVRKNTTNRTVYRSDVVEKMTASLPDKAGNIIQLIIDKGNRLNLARQIRDLGDKCRQLLLLFEDGYSDKEIALLAEYNAADVVKTSRLRCLEKLREKVRNRLYE